jgi:hypothetical protein
MCDFGVCWVALATGSKAIDITRLKFPILKAVIEFSMKIQVIQKVNCHWYLKQHYTKIYNLFIDIKERETDHWQHYLPKLQGVFVSCVSGHCKHNFAHAIPKQIQNKNFPMV